jgi:phosphoenolpyruvate carboxykinase (GTP)
MAMLPFCGYNMGDYWAHWLEVGRKLGSRAPRIFQVNWFRKDADGSYLWPGFGENSRPIEWALRRVNGEVDAIDAISGRIPSPGDLNLEGLDMTEDHVAKLFAFDDQAWSAEADVTSEYFAQFGDHAPAALYGQLDKLKARIAAHRG